MKPPPRSFFTPNETEGAPVRSPSQNVGGVNGSVGMIPFNAIAWLWRLPLPAKSPPTSAPIVDLETSSQLPIVAVADKKVTIFQLSCSSHTAYFSNRCTALLRCGPNERFFAKHPNGNGYSRLEASMLRSEGSMLTFSYVRSFVSDRTGSTI